MNINDFHLSTVGAKASGTAKNGAPDNGADGLFGDVLNQQLDAEATPVADPTGSVPAVATGPVPEVAATDDTEETLVPVNNAANDWLSLFAETQAVLNPLPLPHPTLAEKSAGTGADTAGKPIGAVLATTTPLQGMAEVAFGLPATETMSASKPPETETPDNRLPVAKSPTEQMVGTLPDGSMSTDTSPKTTVAQADWLVTPPTQAVSLPVVAVPTSSAPAGNAASPGRSASSNNKGNLLLDNDTLSASAARSLADRFASSRSEVVPLSAGATPLPMGPLKGGNTEAFPNPVASALAPTEGGTALAPAFENRLNAVSASLSPSAPATPHHVGTPFGQTGWDQAIGQRLVWMAQDKLQSASLTLNPPHLGPLQVTLQLDPQQQASVQFVAHSPEVRQALQEAMPMLRDMFAQSGLQLGQADVGSRQPQPQNQQAYAPNKATGKANPEVTDPEGATPVNSGQGLVNLMA